MDLPGVVGGVLVRTIFEWNKIQIDQYLPDTANIVEFYFRQLPPLVIHGNVTGATELSKGKYLVTLDTPAPAQQFAGSLMVASGKGYSVEAITPDGLIVRAEKNTNLVNMSNDNEYFIDEVFSPPAGDFLMAENLTTPGNWEKQVLTINIPGIHVPVSDPVEIDPANLPGIYEFTIPGLGAPPGGVHSWFKGSVFIEDGSILQVWKLDIANNKIWAFDPESTNPGCQGLAIPGTDNRYYPGFRLYLTESNGLTKAEVMPQAGEPQKITFIGARAVDTAKDCASPITIPSAVVAHDIREPKMPTILAGPMFATRPDFYGKATFTFDVQVDNSGGEPYALVFYRADAQKIIRLLYNTLEAETLLNNFDLMPGINNPAFSTLWSEFVNGTIGGIFNAPNNENYTIPVPEPSLKNHPFKSNNPNPTSVQLYYNPDGSIVSENRPMQQIIADAIADAFVPLTTQPLIYQLIGQATGLIETSAAPPVLKNDMGEPLSPDHPDFKPHPIAIRFGGNKVRFTDYTLDGSSTGFYFYFAVELSNRLEMSQRSPIIGPVQLVNTFPPEAVAIKKVTVQTANPLFDFPAGVRFEVNQFVEAEHIKRFQIFRSASAQDALSVRTMSLAQTIEAGAPLMDDFSDLSFPPYGEPIFYRIVALREIINEENQLEYVPSEPSNTALTSIIDVRNPDAPLLSFTGNSSGNQIFDVHITWSKTVHNGIYYLYKMNQFGNWVKIHQVETNLAAIDVNWADTNLSTGTLEKVNAAGDPVYHHFKVVAENASGLLSLDERVLTI